MSHLVLSPAQETSEASTPADLLARLAELESEMTRRELELANVKVELQTLQGRYLQNVGVLYAELAAIEAAIAEAEGRTPIAAPDDEPLDEDPAATNSDATRLAPSDTLKRVFRDVAKAIHPDLALDEPARCRRHSLMAEANRAYAERD